MKPLVPLLSITGILSAATLLVPWEYSTIQQAIDASVNGDTVLVGAGTYEGTIGFGAKNIVVRSAAGPELTLIRTFREFYCVYIEDGEDSTAVLEGFRLLNQMTDEEAPDLSSPDRGDYGGGIYIHSASPTIRGNILDGCKPENGAINAWYSSSLIEDNEITNNFNSGIYVANQGSSGPIRIVGNTISGNDAQYGAGIRLNDVWAELEGNVIEDNMVSGYGGGVYVSGDSALITTNTIVNNYSGNYGRGININNGVITITNCIICENYAGRSGGGIRETSILPITIINNSIINNFTAILSDRYGGGVTSIYNAVELLNNIITGNQSGNGSQVAFFSNSEYPTYAQLHYSNVQDGLDSIWTDSLTTLLWGPGNIDADPLFESGPFGDCHLSYGSPCIDAGDPDLQYNDPEDPFNPGYALWPAMGTLRNDMGAFGGGGVGYWLGVEEETTPPPPGEALLRSFPNPFREGCTVCFRLPEGSDARLEVYDRSGRLVSTLLDGPVTSPGTTAWLDGSGLPSGTYLILLRSGELTESRNCVLLR